VPELQVPIVGQDFLGFPHFDHQLGQGSQVRCRLNQPISYRNDLMSMALAAVACTSSNTRSFGSNNTPAPSVKVDELRFNSILLDATSWETQLTHFSGSSSRSHSRSCPRFTSRLARPCDVDWGSGLDGQRFRSHYHFPPRALGLISPDAGALVALRCQTDSMTSARCSQSRTSCRGREGQPHIG